MQACSHNIYMQIGRGSHIYPLVGGESSTFGESPKWQVDTTDSHLSDSTANSRFPDPNLVETALEREDIFFSDFSHWESFTTSF